jgi:Na+-translocating ferredoxin:NAD+ oxidoreductase subunit C
MKTFKGGIHPEEFKDITEEKTIEDCFLPDMVTIALSQHLGRPAKPIVKINDLVKEGDLIAEADGFISAPIHSPVSGKVKKIGKFPNVSGLLTDSIQIERDINIEPKKWVRNKKTNITNEEFVEIVKNKGIVGLGGAGFPTYVKFLKKEGAVIDTILINACECEPYLNVDYRAMIEETSMFLEGLNLIKNQTQATKIVVGIEDNKPKAIKLLSSKIQNDSNIEVVALKTKYPQGGEKMLVKAALNRTVPRGGLPLDVGVVVVNVNTVIAIAKAVCFDQPILEKVITVSGGGVNIPKNLRVKIGTKFSEVLDFCGGTNNRMERLVVGGPMMGFSQSDDQASVTKTTTGLLCLTKKEVGNDTILPCLRCGSCVAQCPMNLLPLDLAKYVEYSRLDMAVKNGLRDCIECGTCVFVCPSKRPLVQLIKLGKIKQNQLEKKG